MIFWLVLCLIPPSVAQTLENAITAEHQGDHGTAIIIYKKLTKDGDERAQSLLGYRYLEGKGVPQSVEMADRYLEPLRKNRLAYFKERLWNGAQMAVYVGSCYIECILDPFVPDKQARAWFLLANDLAPVHRKGHIQGRIAKFYERASGRHPYLIDQAVYWYRKAIVSGHTNLLTLRFRICDRLHLPASNDLASCLYQDGSLIGSPDK